MCLHQDSVATNSRDMNIAHRSRRNERVVEHVLIIHTRQAIVEENTLNYVIPLLNLYSC